MSIEDLVSTRQLVKIGNLVLDATMRENHGMTSKVTEFPVEDGAAISDNIVNNPREVTVEGLISNSPTQILGGRLDKQARGTVVNGKLFGKNINRAELAFQELERMHDAKELVTLVGRFKTYKNMAMTEAPVNRTPQDGDVIQFSVSFREVRKVSLQTASFKALFTKKETAQPVKNKGQQTGSKSTAPTEKKVTILKQISNGISSLLAGKGSL